MKRGEEENSESIPFDLVIEILTRLPSKFIARFRCISKLWHSTLCGSNFTESFFNISVSRPKLMFTCLKDGETFFFTSPQPQSNSSSSAANLQVSFPINLPRDICRPVRGLVFGLSQNKGCGVFDYVPLVCNPSTGQFLILPKRVDVRRICCTCLGYDPIDKQFKVLGITYNSEKCHVITLETKKKMSWRMIECDIPHYPAHMDTRDYYYVHDEICIQGVCYYFAWLDQDTKNRVVCFDIRSEKFESIRQAEGMLISSKTMYQSALVNHKGKLAKLQLNTVGGICRGIQLWVLKDAKRHEWLNHMYVPPHPWNNIVKETELRCIGTTSTGEIVLSPNTSISDSFYLVYYNPERNTIKRVGIQGMEAFKNCKAYIFLDHVEDVRDFKLMVNVI